MKWESRFFEKEMVLLDVSQEDDISLLPMFFELVRPREDFWGRGRGVVFKTILQELFAANAAIYGVVQL